MRVISTKSSFLEI
uniref:Uncharacterized protein n=1 Tax=Arundo donax TaxID=35708 RepID=A0A0A8YRB5_ARUDO